MLDANPLRFFAAVAVAAAAIALAGPAAAASDLGRLDFPTSASASAQEHFLRGVGALHSFWYDEAADEFRAAQKIEPGFALAYWGEAMTVNHPVWGEEDLAAARAVLARLGGTAAARAAKAPTEREKAWLGAVETLYGEGEKPARDRAYSEAMRRLYESHPDDVEAGSFYALSLIGPAWASDGATFGEPRERVLMRAAAVLEELFAKNREHPGVVHYLIHAYDDPTHAPLGLRAARVYAQIAPAAFHALHMPSHIFVQLGRWDDVAASNEASWAASVAWSERRGLAVEKRDFHSLTWLAYAYLQQGRFGKARETVEIARRAAAASPSSRIASALDAIEARVWVETRAWNEAKLPPAAGPGGESGARVFAAGLAAARRGDAAAAGAAIARLQAMPPGGHHGYGAGALAVMEKEISGVLQLGGRPEERQAGLSLLAEAARAEEAMTPPSGPPELLAPALELYGEALLQAGQPAEAAQQFERALLRMPNRTAALLGAARAAARLGHEDEARQKYATLAAIWRRADDGLPEVAEARAHRGEARTR